MNSSDTPARLGYRFPAEWELHAGTWLAWPHNPETWPGKRQPVLPVFARFVEMLAEVETVHVLAGGSAILEEARRFLVRHPRIELHDIQTNDAWVRDHGPTFLGGAPSLPHALIDWQFNSWGGKYPPYDLDNDVPRRIAELTGRRRFEVNVILEGGAIDGNGRGTILTTRSCLLHPRRNPDWTERQFEQLLGEYLGARKVVWLEGELMGDDTDGHIDQMARFVGPRTVVACRERDASDENHAVLEANWSLLEEAVDQDGWRMELIELPMPRVSYYEGRRLPASYANFYIANQLVIVPQYEDARRDRQALEVLQGVFPGRAIVGLPALDLVWGLGAFHCLSQQEPA